MYAIVEPLRACAKTLIYGPRLSAEQELLIEALAASIAAHYPPDYAFRHSSTEEDVMPHTPSPEFVEKLADWLDVEPKPRDPEVHVTDEPDKPRDHDDKDRDKDRVDKAREKDREKGHDHDDKPKGKHKKQDDDPTPLIDALGEEMGRPIAGHARQAVQEEMLATRERGDRDALALAARMVYFADQHGQLGD